MPLDPAEVRELTLDFGAARWLRIFRRDHADTPLGTGPGSSRFSSPSGAYQLLYAASSLDSALAETIVRDRFASKTRPERRIGVDEIARYAVAEISTVERLRVLDLRTTGPLRLGVSTDAVGARSHADGQRFAEDLHARFQEIDGVLYLSRLTRGPCLAVFHRAIGRKLKASRAVGLECVDDLPEALRRLAVTLVTP